MTSSGVGLFEKGTKNESPLQGINHHITLLGMYLSVHTTQYFTNHSKVPVEMVYKFHYEHTPHHLVVTLTDPETGKVEVLVGKMEKKEVAIEKYDENLAEGNRAVMMERDEVDTSLYILSLGNIKSKMEIKIETTSVQQTTLETDDYYDDGVIEFIYSIPAMFPDTHGESNLMEVSLSLENMEKKNIVKVSSLSHPGIMKGESDFLWKTNALVSVTRDFDASVKVKGIPLSSFVVSPVDYKSFKYAGVFSLLPSFHVEDEGSVINEITIIVDCSGSMSGSRIQCARKALRLLMHSLDVERNIHYNFYRFGSSFRRLFDEPVKLEEGENFKVSLQYVEGMKANLGGTNMLNPLKHYFESIPTEEDGDEGEGEMFGKRGMARGVTTRTKRQLFLFTDGEDSYCDQILKLLEEKKEEVRCFSFGIGRGVNTRFLTRCADTTNGTAAFIQDMKTEMNGIVMRQLSKSFRETIEDISITFKMKNDEAEKKIISTDEPAKSGEKKELIRTTKIPFAYNGTSQHVFYFLESLPEDISVSYTFQKKKIEDEKVSTKQFDNEEEGRYIGVMVAQDMFKKSESTMSKEEQTDLGLTFHIPTKHTSYFLRQVVNEEEEETEGEREIIQESMKVVDVQVPVTGDRWDYQNTEFKPTTTTNAFSSSNDDTKYFEEDFTGEQIKRTFAVPVSKKQDLAFKSFTFSRDGSSTSYTSSSSYSPPSSTTTTTTRKSSFEKRNLRRPSSGPYDDYQELKVIGRGSFGKVIKVSDKKSKNILAMKIMKKSMLQTPISAYLEAKNLMMKLNHPFINKLVRSFEKDDKIFLLYEFLAGGELFFHLKNETMFTEDKARFYAAEIALALGQFHKNEAIYRDLKPENCVLDGDGHCVLTGIQTLGSYDEKNQPITFCGTPEYLSPEILKGEKYDKSVDWWSFGVLLYEMLTGLPPFYSENINEMYDLILNAPLKIDPRSKMSKDAENIIKSLLDRDPSKRLGSSKEDVEEIKYHPFFKTIDWNLLEQRKLTPPVVKSYTSSSSYFSSFSDDWFRSDVDHPCEADAIRKDLKGSGNIYVELLEIKGVKEAVKEENCSKLMLVCDMKGIWKLEKRCCGLIGIEEEKIKERYKKIICEGGIDVWMTAIVVAVFQTFYKSKRTEWRMIINKSKRNIMKWTKEGFDKIDILEEAQLFVNELIV